MAKFLSTSSLFAFEFNAAKYRVKSQSRDSDSFGNLWIHARHFLLS
jgi:hypothetical protein